MRAYCFWIVSTFLSFPLNSISGAYMRKGQAAIMKPLVSARSLRGQAAMEYLMTYGWALLVIVLVLGALIYLGVLNPGSRLQDTCNLPIGFKCDVGGLAGTEGKLNLTITNQQAITLYYVGTACKTGTGVQTTDVTKGVGQIAPGSSQSFECSLADFTGKQIGEVASGEVMLGYSDAPASPTKYVKGTFTAKVSRP
jgi:hypothetical protein